MENDAAVAAYERALEAGGPRQLGFGFRLPRLRDPRLSTAAAVAAWGVAGLLSTIVPDLVANRDHVLLYFIVLMAAVLLLLLAVAAPDLHVAERVAGRLEGWLRAMLFRGA
ncbi:hypothetical protein SEVIR_1G074900v4 [Setaria viridis]|uniref:Uncharacterized protein n=2 Tax=Setaria TaxID=4554 RepID=A0A368PI54_SETIT|nr:hypothetical protein SETIT_1G076700v2 [Setaria italica]TKW37839.1 hypothetical protein SEVIR_1G074900v2 [Setaria viridis]